MSQSANQPNQVKYLRVEKVALRLGVSGSTIWLWVKKETFPAPVKLSSNVTVWDIEDILQWEAERKSKRAEGP